MTIKMKLRRAWEYQSDHPVESLSVAGLSGDTVMCDHRDRVTFIGPDGKMIWDNKMDLAPLEVKVTADGESVIILSYDGTLIMANRYAEEEWRLWVTKDASKLAIKSKGQSIVVASFKGRFHVVNGVGKRGRIVHTPEPVAHVRISARSGQLFAASAQGWVGLYDNRFSPIGEFYLEIPVGEVEVSEFGKKIFLPARQEGINVIELETMDMTTYHPGFAVSRIGIDEKGELIVAVGLKGGISLMNIKGDIIWKKESKHSWALCEMNGEGDRFVIVSDKGYVVCYELIRGVDKTKAGFDFVEIDEEKKEGKKGSDNFDFIEV